MQFLKRHYEKIILTLVLMGLVGAAVWLFLRVGKVQEELKDKLASIEKTTGQGEFPLPDFSVYTNALVHATNPAPIDLGHGHLVFNPVRWQVKNDGSLIKIQSGKEVGPDAVVVTKIVPLDLILSLVEVRGTSESPNFQVGIERQSAAKAQDRNKIQRFLSGTQKITFPLDAATVTVTLKELKGTPEMPELTLEVTLPEGAEPVTITKEKAWNKNMGYAADMVYPPENGDFKGRRVGDSLAVAGEAYKIIAIGDKQVVLSTANDKRFLIPYKPAP